MHRFVRIDPATVVQDRPLWRASRLRQVQSGDALFLGYLWQHFGPVDIDSVQYEGYSYLIQDTQTGLIIDAYQGASGPAFQAGTRENEALIQQVLNEFEDFLESRPAAECEVEFETDYGWCRIGIRHGQPFEEMEHH